MPKMKQKRPKKASTDYGKEYFTGSFHGAVGNFTKQDLKRSINWFSGWFRYLESFVPIRGNSEREALEVGCSIGGAANVLSQFGYKVTATDISSYAVKRAQKLSPNIIFKVHDIEKPLRQKDRYNLAYAFEVIEHLPDPKLGIRNIFEATKPGGYIICSTQFPYSFAFDEPTHISIKYPKEWQQIFEQVGFANIRVFRGTFVPYFYRYHQVFSQGFSFPVGLKWINSTVFIVGRKPLRAAKQSAPNGSSSKKQSNAKKRKTLELQQYL